MVKFERYECKSSQNPQNPNLCTLLSLHKSSVVLFYSGTGVNLREKSKGGFQRPCLSNPKSRNRIMKNLNDDDSLKCISATSKMVELALVFSSPASLCVLIIIRFVLISTLFKLKILMT